MTLRTDVGIALLVTIVVVALVMTVVTPIVWQRRAAAACARLERLHELPFAGEPATDPVQLALREQGRMAFPCLVDRVTDTKAMSDPRKAPPYPGFVVGDAAVLVLADLGALQLPDSLPEPVRARWPEQGMYAYFEYVKDPAHRRELQESLRRRLNPGH